MDNSLELTVIVQVQAAPEVGETLSVIGTSLVFVIVAVVVDILVTVLVLVLVASWATVLIVLWVTIAAALVVVMVLTREHVVDIDMNCFLTYFVSKLVNKLFT